MHFVYNAKVYSVLTYSKISWLTTSCTTDVQ